VSTTASTVDCERV